MVLEVPSNLWKHPYRSDSFGLYIPRAILNPSIDFSVSSLGFWKFDTAQSETKDENTLRDLNIRKDWTLKVPSWARAEKWVGKKAEAENT